jgi:hypothetical protein
MGEKKKAYRILVGRSEGKRPIERPRNKREDTIEMDSEEVGWEGMDWTHLAQDREGQVVCCCEDGNELLDSIKRV